MNANKLAPLPADSQSHLAGQAEVSLRLLPAQESVRTGNGNGQAQATAAPPFWTWFIENPRRSRSV